VLNGCDNEEIKPDEKANKLSEAIGEDLCGVVLESLDKGERTLDTHIIRYLAEHWPLAAASACILRPQTSRFRPKLFQYALSATSSYEVLSVPPFYGLVW